MSATKTLRSPDGSSLQGTRQLLDELDALMEKMLSLPVGDTDTPTPPPPELRLPTLSATLTVLEPPAPASAKPTASAPTTPAAQTREESLASPARWSSPADLTPRSSPVDPALPPAPSYAVSLDPAEEEDRFAPMQPLEPPEEAPQEAPNQAASAPIPPPILDLRIPEVTTLPLPQRSWKGLAAAPVWWLNAGFDLLTRPFGLPGRWLRVGSGRTLLGYAGIGLLLAAGLWLIKDWMGWTW
jgi:hypothetical protein